MSYLDSPRITFASRFLSDVPTMNNDLAGFGFELKLARQALAATPVVSNAIPSGLNAGPVFVRTVINE